MGLFAKATPAEAEKSSETTPGHSSESSLPVAKAEEEGQVTTLAIILGVLASLGGFMSGYESGQISGFMAMSDFKARFSDNGTFSPAREGTIVGLLSIGTLIGCLACAPLADKIGRRYAISSSAFFYIIGVIIEITSSRQWVQFAIGRLVSGLGIGALSTAVPMYQSESTPKKIRNAVVSSYQLFLTLGIWLAYMVNFGTSTRSGSSQWRITNGLSAAWAVILGTSILFMPESPRFAYRVGREEEARRNMARLNGVDEYSNLINDEINEVETKLQAERAGGEHAWYECFTGPRMAYRIMIGLVLQAGQQLTGANYYFYYGTTIFTATGIDDSYVTSIILGSVNVFATVMGIYMNQHIGKRKALIYGALWMFMCFFIFSFVGEYKLNRDDPTSTPQAGSILIVFACLFIVAFAATWGPLVWAVVGELYPARYRATCMALATASNWLWNFLISFFTTFITNDIHYFYGLIFGCCCLSLAVFVFFFVIESNGRSLEEIDTMYVLHVNPIGSEKWVGGDLVNQVATDNMHLKPGGRAKVDEAGNQGGFFAQREHAADNSSEAGSKEQV